MKNKSGKPNHKQQIKKPKLKNHKNFHEPKSNLGVTAKVGGGNGGEAPSKATHGFD